MSDFYRDFNHVFHSTLRRPSGDLWLRRRCDRPVHAYRFITLQEHLSVHEAREHFISQLDSDDIPGQVFVVAGRKLRGSLSVKKLLQEGDVGQSIRYLMDSCLFRVKPDDERPQVIAELTERGLDLVPVVDKGELVGCLMERRSPICWRMTSPKTPAAGGDATAGKPYLEISPLTLWKKRSVWLLLLFVAEAYTSSVLQHFEEALESAIALAFFIPLLIGTGGNSGTQITSTLVRSMALGEVRLRDMGRVIRKEVSTSFLIALTLGLAGCLRAWMMGIGMEITLIVSLTLVCITLWSAIVSSIIPMVLKRIGIDPAVVSAPFIATLIDGTGLIIYFKIAQYFLGLN